MTASKTSPKSKLFQIVWLVIVIGLTTTAAHSEVTALSSDFSSNSLSYGSGGWFAMGTYGGVPTITTDNTAPLSGNVLSFYYNNIALIGSFAPVTLTKAGDYIQATYNVRYSVLPSATNTGPALGLYTTNGTYLSANSAGSTGATSDDRGYKFYKMRNASSDLTLVRNATGFGSNDSGGTPTILATGTTGVPIDNVATVHTLTLKIALASNLVDLVITTTFDGCSSNQTVTGSDVVTYAFDELGLQPFGNWAASSALVDNIMVTTNAVILNSDFSSNSLSYGSGGWFAMGTYGGVPTITTDNMAPLSGNVLSFYYNNIALIGSFTPVTLAKAGDCIQATYNVRYSVLPSTTNTGPALGLYTAKGTYLSANSVGSTGVTSDDKGYKVYKMRGDSSDLTLVRNATGFGSNDSGGTPTILATGTTGVPIDNAATVHTQTLKIALASNLEDLVITTTFDGYSSSQTVTGSDVVTYTFDELGLQPFGNWGCSSALVDNIMVSTNVVPCFAQKQGYEKVFEDDFNDPGTIDFNNTQASGYNWYRQFFFGWPVTSSGAITVSNSILTLSGTGQSGALLSTATPANNADGWLGQVWRNGGYFEARIRFNPFLHTNSSGWPSFWSMAIEHLAGKGADQWTGQPTGYTHFGEIDFFEYLTWSWMGDNTSYAATVHDWYGNWSEDTGYMSVNNQGYGSSFNNATVVIPGGTDFSQWHTYGCLWVPSVNGMQGYIQYYFDNCPLGGLITWTGTPQTAPPVSPWQFSIFDQQGFAVILGTGDNWPMDVDWVRVWQP